MSLIEKISPTDSIVNLLQKQVAISKLDWVTNLRESAFNNFKKMGIPNRRHEEWKYTTPEPLFKKDYSIACAIDLNVSVVNHFKNIVPNAYTIVTINGYYSNELSSNNIKEKLVVCNMKDAFIQHEEIVKKYIAKYTFAQDTFAQLNNATYTSGAFVYLKAYEHVSNPIQIINIVTGSNIQFINSRNLIVVDGHSSCSIVEYYVAADLTAQTLRNHVTELHIGEAANVKYDVLQNENELVSTINAVYVNQLDKSEFCTNTITLAGAYIRNNLSIALNGKNINTHLNGLFIAANNQLIDNHTMVDHIQPNCNSNELYKGVLKDSATGVFNGKIYVRQDAQKTNAYQSSKNMLLSADATINTKPQLEIYADDVKCSHGTSTGEIDEDALFYLQARGIGKETAKLLMMQAFAEEVVEKVNNIHLKEHILSLLDKKLNN